jgi:S1-C subfamily serine protease/uncharacterized membrane protein YfcA
MNNKRHTQSQIIWLALTAINLGFFAWPLAVSAIPPPSALDNFQTEAQQAIARIKPAVVKISSTHGLAGQPAAGLYRSIGSGVIIDPRGYVLTNDHVVKESGNIQVTLWRVPPTTVTGTIIHQSQKQDLALIKLAGRGPYPYINIGRPGSMQTGDWVIAVGSPFGLEHSASLGIISDTSRSLWIDGTLYENLIQTDAAINQGNSGGPLINMRGDLIGINTAIYAPHGIFSGVGFAIPAARALAYLQAILPAISRGPIVINSPAIHSQKTPTSPGLVQAAFSPGEALNAPLITKPLSKQQNAAHRDWKVIQHSAALVFLAAVLFNMLGLGGGFVYVPILLFFGVSFHVASASSLFIIAAAHAAALFVFMRSRLIDYRLAMLLEPVTCLGAFLGGISSDIMSETQLSSIFGFILLIASYLMHRSPTHRARAPVAISANWTWQRSFGSHEYAIDLTIGLPVAFAIGYFGGMLGFAGGILKVPMLVILFGVPIKVAIATSSLMVAITSLVGCIGHGLVGHFDARIAIILAITAILGGQIGARLTLGADRQLLKRLFGVVLLAVALWMIGRVL